MFHFPDVDERVAINGHTGSGKTVGGIWLLSEAPFHKQPYIIIDFKEEKLFRQMPKLRVLDHDVGEMPDQEGLWTLRVLPTESYRDKISQYLHKIWKAGEIGVFIDEGHEMPASDELKTILITGRSRKIPVICCSQRPVSVPRHLIS
jgi:hypothetical protein